MRPAWLHASGILSRGSLIGVDDDPKRVEEVPAKLAELHKRFEIGAAGVIIPRVSSVEHLLVAETGVDRGSRYAVMAGVRVEDPLAVAECLADESDGRVLDVLKDLAFEIRIAFASKQRLETIGDDWRYAFLSDLTVDAFNPNRLDRPRGYPLVAHLPEGIPFDFTWLDAYLTGAHFGFIRVRTKVVAPDDRLLALPRLVAGAFHDAIESDRGRPGPARDRYDALAPLVTHVEDVGLNVSYFRNGNTADAIVRAGISS